MKDLDGLPRKTQLLQQQIFCEVKDSEVTRWKWSGETRRKKSAFSRQKVLVSLLTKCL